MGRLEGWEDRLNAAIERRAGESRVWGRNDCALTVATFIEAQTGRDPAAFYFRGKYKTEAGAAKRMLRFAGGGVEAVAQKIAEAQGWRAVAVAFAQRGDVVMREVEGGEIVLGIVGMTGAAALFVGAESLIEFPVTECARAWSLG